MHNTNGCTYGSEQACAKHGPRESVASYAKPGAAQAKRAAYTAVGARGVWCKGAIWRKVRVDEPLPLTKALDLLARAKVAYTGPGYIVRKARVTK